MRYVCGAAWRRNGVADTGIVLLLSKSCQLTSLCCSISRDQACVPVGDVRLADASGCS